MLHPITWLLKLLIAHLLTDFVFQPSSWIEKRRQKHFATGGLYLHGLITALGVLLFIGWQYWMVILIIFVTHILIDGWKSYQKTNLIYFLADQFLHVLVIVACYCITFLKPGDIEEAWKQFTIDSHFWKLALAVIFLTMPTSYLVGIATKGWRDRITSTADDTLANAGQWVGIIERIIVLVLVLYDKYEAIGLLVAAKTLIRFNEKDRPEIKTEYLMIGTLLSIGIAIVTGILLQL